MAIYHFSTKTFGRSDGYSAVAAAAYRSGERLTDDRTGETHDYRTRGGVESVSLHLPTGVQMMSRSDFWNKAEAAEKRINSTVAREFEVSLPNELSVKTQIALANELACHVVNKFNCGVDAGVHMPTAKNDARNGHAHLLLSTREVNLDGSIGAKTRVLDGFRTGAAVIIECRKFWADICNRELALAGFSTRIDHRSFVDQGIEKMPTRHHGNGPKAEQIKLENTDIQKLNQINAELAALLKERAQLTAQETIREASLKAQADAKKQAEMPTLAQLSAQRLDATNKAMEATQVITKAKTDRERASPQKFVFEAREALPSALEKLETAKSDFEALEAKGTPWWAPWRRAALERAEVAYSTAKTDAKDLTREARAPILEEVEKARREAEKQLQEAQKERERVEFQMLNADPPMPAQNATMAKIAKRL